MSKRSLNGRNVAKNIGAQPPVRKITDPDTGLVRTEKLCPIPHNIKCVDPDGNVVSIPLSNGYVRNQTQDYTNMVIQEKLDAGFLPYDVCPYSPHGQMAGKKKACEGAFTKDKCCKHITEIALKRRAAKQAKVQKFASRFESSADKMVRQLEKQNRMLARPEGGKRAMPGG
jgi:hypothetical protein